MVVINAVEYLKALAIVEMCRAGLEYQIEHSDRSEAVYLKLRRGNFWYGIRIASHPPFYRSSADPEQVLVPLHVPDVSDIAEQERLLVDAIYSGGRVIADPIEVDQAIFAAWRQKRDGTRRSGEGRTAWRWDESNLRWQLISIGGKAPDPAEIVLHADLAPPQPPRPRLSPHEESAIRHRLNARARWEYDESLAFARQA